MAAEAAKVDAREAREVDVAGDEEEAPTPPLHCIAQGATGSPNGSEVLPPKHPAPLRSRQEKPVSDNKSENEVKGSPGVLGIFRYATFSDILILTVGSIFASIHGACLPCLALFFGHMTNSLIRQFGAGNMHNGDARLSNGSFSVIESTTDSNTWPDNFGTAAMSRYSIYFVYIGVGAFLAGFMQSLCWETSCERIIHRMRRLYFAQLLRQDISWYDQKQSGALLSKLSDDMERIREGIGVKYSMVIQYISSFIAGFGVGLYANWRLTLVIMAVSPILIGTTASLSQGVSSSLARQQLKYAIAASAAEEVLNNIRTVAAFGGQNKASLWYEKCLEEGRRLGMKKYYIVSVGFGVVYALTYASYGLTYWYGSRLVASGDASPGSVFTVFFGVMAGAFSLGGALPFVTAVSTALGAAGTVFEVIERVPDIDSYAKAGIKPEKIDARIAFQNVTFQYPTRPETEVLKDFNMNIKPGQTVALVGSSGSGKSTVMSLLLRFYNFSHGKILLDGRDIKSLNLEWLRCQIGLVSQEPVLFGISILDNIKYGYHNVSFNDVMHAAKLSNAHDFISSMPKGYDTLVGASGAQLSGGQKQRIAIARALVRNPKILLLDEATSALDAQSEGEVQAALEQAMQGRTTIVIAHRLSTVRNADVIYVMKDGCVEEQGTHEELLLTQGHYYSLVQAQIFHEVNKNNTYPDDSSILVPEAGRNNQHESLSASMEAFPLAVDIQKKLENESVSRDGFEWARVWKLQLPEWPLLLVGFSACIFYGASLPALTYFYGEMFETFTLSSQELYKAAQFWSGMFLVVAVAYGCSFVVTGAFLTIAAEILIVRIRSKAFKNILNQAVGWFDMESTSPGRLISRLARDAPFMMAISGVRAGLMTSALITLIAAVGIALYHGWKLALLVFVGVPILVGASYQQTRMLRGTQRRDAELIEQAGKIASESVENIRTVQALGQENLFVKLYMEKFSEPYKSMKKQACLYSWVFSISQTVIYFMYAATFSLGSYFIQNGAMEPGDVYKVFFALTFCAASAGQTAGYFRDLAQAKISVTLMFQLIDKETDISIDPGTGIKPEISGNVSLRSVHFHYQNRPGVSVLQDLNLTVEEGKTLALVGSSGSGKSTVVSLLERFYDPSRGVVEVDGYDTSTLNLQYLRKHIGLVSQEPKLFNFSIWENIAYGVISEDPNSDHVVKLMPQIIDAAREANIHDFICSLPEGYSTRVGEKGSQLSGGQKQRIAIARALIRNPKILLLDEATSALDAENEKIVQEALDQARQGRTCIVIAHRLSTIQNADSIAVVHQGRVVEQGSHEELMALKGRYHLLVQRQT